jgi:uncharacterized protein (TIGR02677 family)
MAGVARSIELQQAEAATVANYKRRLIDYLERFMGDLIRRSDTIAKLILELSAVVDPLLVLVAERQARDAAPGDEQQSADAVTLHADAWRERWRGLRGWFLATGHEPPQAELLRARARSAIPQLLGAIATINERRGGRSDRSADFRILATWFADCQDDGEAHRLARAAFALNPARHFSMNTDPDAELPASTSWAAAPPLVIHPRLREFGEAAPRGPLARVRDRASDRHLLAVELAEESRQVEAARARLATGRATRLSELGPLDEHAFGLFLNLLGEALSDQWEPDAETERQTGDGLLHIRLQPLAADSRAQIQTPNGVFAGRDYLITITSTQRPAAPTTSPVTPPLAEPGTSPEAQRLAGPGASPVTPPLAEPGTSPEAQRLAGPGASPVTPPLAEPGGSPATPTLAEPGRSPGAQRRAAPGSSPAQVEPTTGGGGLRTGIPA